MTVVTTDFEHQSPQHYKEEDNNQLDPDPSGIAMPRWSSEEEEKEEEPKNEDDIQNTVHSATSNNSILKKAMDASDVITSMRTVLEESMKQVQPPMPAYTRPLQRQQWGDIQITPHKEWGDIFFDLFYVAGAYNLGNMLREEPTLRGFCYFMSCFFSLQNLWQLKMHYDSRFYLNSNDMFHNFYEMCTLIVLGTAVLYCRPVVILSNPEEHNDLFVFCSSICIGTFLIIGRLLEVSWMIEGGEESAGARAACKREARMYSVLALVQAVAAVYAGYLYHTNDHDKGSYGSDYESSYSSIYGNSTSSTYGDSYNGTESSEGYSVAHVEDDGHHFRYLAGESSYGDKENNYSGDIAMELLMAGYVANHVITALLLLVLIPRLAVEELRKITVPMNIDYTIHRYGEWTMLMLGESVLSLLIVGAQQNYDYYKTFYCGIASISLLQYMHFQSQPHHADDHALRRKRERGYTFVILVQLYSAALIILGASYKMMLYEYMYAADYAEASGYGDGEGSDDHHRTLFTALGAKLHRFLAGGGGGALRFDPEDREQRVAHFFCGSMAAIWFLCDMLILVHRGIDENLQRCKDLPRSKLVKMLGVPLVLARVVLVAFMATVSQYETDPSFLAFSGLVGILAQVVLRMIGTSLYREETEEDHVMQEIMTLGLKSQEFKLD